MTRIFSEGLHHNLVLADGSRWIISSGDNEAASVISHLHYTMQLSVTAGSVERSHDSVVRRILVLVDVHKPEAYPPRCYVTLPSESDGLVVCALRPSPDRDGLFVQLLQLSLIIARDAQSRGGVLLHGALAERDGFGVILAAPGGTGKTTASNRFPAPWKSLCDDTTLVVRDTQGNYWAHPWPTWSHLLWEEPKGSWKVQDAVPLKAIFFLTRALQDRTEKVGCGQAVTLLVQYAAQASQLMTRGLGEKARGLKLEQFNNLCALAKVVPAHTLHISLTGTFWQEIERALEVNQSQEM